MDNQACRGAREKGLKVIGAGFGRTGTSSLKVALEELGLGPCYHMSEVPRHPEHLPQWEAASRRDAVDWYTLFMDYQATVDWPSCSFYEELMQAYPEAKVVLTVRDPEQWYESALSTIYYPRRMKRSLPFPLYLLFKIRKLAIIGKMIRKRFFRRISMLDAVIWDGIFKGRFEDKAYAISIFEQHTEEVKKRVPTEKLLVYDVKDGWEPLCTFLGVEMPEDKPFPYLNNRASFGSKRTQATLPVGLSSAREM